MQKSECRIQNAERACDGNESDNVGLGRHDESSGDITCESTDCRLALGRARRHQRGDVRQLLRLRLDRTGARDSLQRLLGFTDTQIGSLNGIYHFPNIVVVLIGGIIVDRFGTRLSTLIFAIICLVGALLTAMSPLFPVMAAGRLVFGLGAKSMIVAITVAIGQWFVGRQLGFAFGVNLSIARAGSYSADLSTTWFKPFYDRGWQPPLLLAAVFAAVAVIACIVYYLLEQRAAKKFDLNQPAASDRFVWADLWRFDRSYWYIVGLCVTFYSVIFPFRSTFAIKYFQHAHGLSLQDAGALNGYVFLAAIFATPAFGLMVDKLEHRAAFMAFGSLLLGRGLRRSSRIPT